MMRGWVSPKTIKYTAQQEAIADGYRNGTTVDALCEKYRLSRTWVYQVIYCYGLAPRTRLTEQRDPLNYWRLQRHLKHQGRSNEVSPKGNTRTIQATSTELASMVCVVPSKGEFAK